MNFKYGEKLGNIVEKTVEAIDDSKTQINEILDKTREEYLDLENEINELKVRVLNVMKEVENLERKEKQSRLKLVYVSKQFGNMFETKVKEAYDEAKDMQIQLILKRQEEKDLINRRNKLERKLLDYKTIVEKAEKLSKQIGVVLKYLTGDFKEMHTQFEELKDRQMMCMRIIEAQEEERKRIAREIHDGPAQTMANVLLKAELCNKLINIDIEESKLEMRNLKNVVQDSLKEVRKIIYDLRPSSIDDIGLLPAVSRYINNFNNETKINVELKVLSEYKKLRSEIEITCFRIIQEALTNIYRHSKAKNALVKLEYGECYISIIIDDDGVGFDSSSGEQGFGLLGMRERVQILSGQFEVHSSINNGTQIYVSIPIDGGIKKDDKYFDCR
ncbi:MAG: sensor histidine kinase [Thermoanaerobacteraceae bacterium]|nr:sensor histidine kinase [Thermoanaerobacteraceae bacterium]